MSRPDPWFAVVAAVVAMVAGCHRASPTSEATTATAQLPQAAYVWQRHWTPAVRTAVTHPLAELDGLHVLAAEVDVHAAVTMVRLDDQALAAAHRPITLVIRVDGTRPIAALSLAPIVALGEQLQRVGVDVVAIEIDHDCATGRLADYAAWLTAQRPPPPWRLSITALPTWAESPALADVAAAVDDIVVQVHAVRAPAIFEAQEAWRDLARFARQIGAARVGRPIGLRVALPTYRAVVRGDEVGVDPGDVVAFVRRLAAHPIAGVTGIVWFRLPVSGDEQTWSAATFARVVTGRPAARAHLELVPRGADRFDLVVTNPGGELADLPPVHVRGDVGEADLVQGYRALRQGQWEAPPRSIAGEQRIVIGWVHGKELELVE